MSFAVFKNGKIRVLNPAVHSEYIINVPLWEIKIIYIQNF